jgi:hypothetical protein
MQDELAVQGVPEEPLWRLFHGFFAAARSGNLARRHFESIVGVGRADV